jgi:2-desacetyl-2-hydroxyethyl bacteriochlorophyllide A dehydrogenase
MRATALQFTAPRTVELREISISPPAAGQILVCTAYSGISSGTEILAFKGEVDPDLPLDERLGSLAGSFRYPFAYGYSCAGEVVESHAELPAGASVFAYHPHQDLFTADASDVVRVEGIPPREATIFPLVETAFQVVLDCGSVMQQDVVVFGLGVLGSLVSQLLADAGARVLAVDPLDWRRQLAARWGIPACPPPALGDALGGRVPRLAVEASGEPAVLQDALDSLGHEGEVVVASWYGTRKAELDLGSRFHRRRLTIRSSQVSTIPAGLSNRWDVPSRRAAVGRLMKELDLSSLATTEFAFEDAAAAFRAIEAREPGVMHVALRYMDPG